MQTATSLARLLEAPKRWFGFLLLKPFPQNRYPIGERRQLSQLEEDSALGPTHEFGNQLPPPVGFTAPETQFPATLSLIVESLQVLVTAPVHGDYRRPKDLP